MIYGYVNVQKKLENREEEIQKQAAQLQTFGAEKIIIETDDDNNQLQAMLDDLQVGDTVHFMELNRLTRSLGMVIADYFKKNNISLYEKNISINLDMFQLAYELSKMFPADYE